ncbi:hypothetical protein P692DRAFT_20880849 [Suillus brevipes Sb2]|nr:hypothetical protein P692DRAFT_20880849 [Suillus brevipes Sb2]
MKVKGTIQDVDGVCSFKVSSRSRKACDVAAHYRMPLHALNKKFGLYRKVVAHLGASSHDGAARMRNIYFSIMDYMNQVRLAFLEDAAQSENALRGDFRCPALDYYLWLDHNGDGFDDHYREALRVTHGVTFERIQNSACLDILASLDWKSYHDANCNEHDCCGALQGCGAGEDSQKLLDAIDSSLNASHAPIDHGPGTDAASTTDSGGAAAPVVIESTCGDSVHDEQRVTYSNSPVSELGLHPQYISDGHAAVEPASIGHQSDCFIVPIPIDLHSNSDIVPHPDNDGVCTSTVDSFIQGESLIHSRGLMTEAPSISEFEMHDCHPSVQGFPMDLMSDSEVVERSNEDCCESELLFTSSHVHEPECDAGVIIDDDKPSMQFISIDMQADSVAGLTPGSDDFHAPMDNTELPKAPGTTGDCRDDVGDPSADQAVDGHNDAAQQSNDISGADNFNESYENILREMFQQEGRSPSPPLQSRLRKRTTSTKPSSMPTTRTRDQPAAKRARPVVYANPKQMRRDTSKTVTPKSRTRTYTEEDLFSESRTQATNATPFIDAFLRDPRGYQLVESSIKSNHMEWLAVARCIASRMDAGSIPTELLQSVAKFMSIELWLDDVANECQERIDGITAGSALSPMVLYIETVNGFG